MFFVTLRNILIRNIMSEEKGGHWVVELAKKMREQDISLKSDYKVTSDMDYASKRIDN